VEYERWENRVHHRRKILKREANGTWLLTSEKYVERDFASER